MPSKSVLKRGFKAEAERISEKLRVELGISKFNPLDAFVLAEYLNITVFSVDEIFSDNLSHPDYQIIQNPDKFSAVWIPNSKGEKIIIHNAKHSLYRQQSNLMHELSHIIRSHEVPLEIAILCAQTGLHYYNKVQEQEAKHLGGCLQLPSAALQWALKSGYSVEEISNYYCASSDMVKYRLGISGAQKIISNQKGKSA